MSDIDKNAAQQFTLSEAQSDRVEHFTTAEAAGRAFADADAANRPRVTERIGDSARKVADTVIIADVPQKSIPPLEQVRTDPANVDAGGKSTEGMGASNIAFWAAYHAREAEKAQAAQKIPGIGDEVTGIAQDAAPAQKKSAQDERSETGTIEPIASPKEPARDARFDTPGSYADRFVITKTGDRQEFFRSYDDQRPAIIDTGDRLATKNADRATAMDMIELAEHRGWQCLRAKGPEEFRREMWIEGQAHGLNVEGYRPSEKDMEEARRRAEMVQSRVIERTDKVTSAQAAASQERGSEQKADGTTRRDNVVQMQTVNFSEGVTGTITEIGTAPYKGREGAEPVPFVRLELGPGREHTLWSVTLSDTLEKHDLKAGDRATFHSPGVEAVTYTTRDKETGEDVQREGHRRIWEARDIERGTGFPQRTNEPALIETDRSDANPNADSSEASKVTDTQRKQDTDPARLEDRIKTYEPGDTPIRGAASALARMEAEMRAAGVPEKDREAARDEASKILAKGLEQGVQYPVQTLPNVSKEQIAKAQDAAKLPQELQRPRDLERTADRAGQDARDR